LVKETIFISRYMIVVMVLGWVTNRVKWFKL